MNFLVPSSEESAPLSEIPSATPADNGVVPLVFRWLLHPYVKQQLFFEMRTSDKRKKGQEFQSYG